MRIAYISLHWPRTRNSGVGKKIQAQLAAWRVMGHEAHLFMHTTPYEPQSELIEADYFFYTPSGKIRTELDRIQAMRRTVSAVRAFHPDVIYLRYGIYVYPAHLLMNIAPVVEEINTDDLTQHEGLGGIYSFYNRLTRGILLRRVHGLVAVSHELAVSPAFASYGKPVAVIANGVDLGATKPMPAPDNQAPRLFFIATPGYNWHGVDQLVKLAQRYPDLVIDVVGYDRIVEVDILPGNINLHGYLDASAYEKVLGKADVAVSTLALYRKRMEEASPLKVREYLAYGLPSVLAYIDTDLEDLDCDFLLKIPNRDDNIETHGDAIRAFAYRMRGRRAERKLLAERIGSGPKEIQRLDFFEKIAQASVK